MTVETFVTEIQVYYGKYSEVEKKYVVQWAERRTAEQRKQIFYITLKTFSNRWGKAPDIAVLEESLKQYMEEQRGKIQGPIGRDPNRLYEPEVLQIEEKPTDEQVRDFFEKLHELTKSKNYRKTEGENGV